ncbi:MAG: DnaJ domain-containing protein [Gammaproteobacteria bacterium]|nr:DnaJ domain-containing protein [Gammaproteobacteria bacterium]
MRNLIILAAAILLYLLAFRWFARQPRKTRIQALMVIAGIVLVGLAAAGRLNWIFALLGALLPFIRRLLTMLNYIPLFQRLYRQFNTGSSSDSAKHATGQQSKVETRFLRLILDHDSGEMRGQVLDGQFNGSSLDQLSLEQLLVLLQECQREDRESTELLEAYLERTHGDEWHTQAQARTDNASSGFSERMTRQEAYDILGLEAEATREQIKTAHRRLIQKLHPDRGGSTYLAWKINQAKALLLEKE